MADVEPEKERRVEGYGRRDYDDLRRSAWELTEAIKRLNEMLSTGGRILLLLIGGGVVAPEFLTKLIQLLTVTN